ncbi:MAG: hypothetical protein L3J22_06170 [Xanthomonadales bacterium]|nr:hypothetical protein [Xanthomonadales bacterium]
MSENPQPKPSQPVLLYSEVDQADLARLLQAYQLELKLADTKTIPGSFWGNEEAGLIGSKLYVRADTPLHSLLHEACHYICMDSKRREGLHTNAGGDYDEENAVCYLQVLLADVLPPCNRQRMWQDMDSWGYSFRLSSARAWFEGDAEDARQWLLDYEIINLDSRPTFRLR